MIRTRKPLLGGRRTSGSVQNTSLVLYVNTTSGNDSNNGRTASTAKATLASALTALTALGGNGTIRITAVSASPVLGFVDIAAGNVTLEGVNQTPWYVERNVTYTSGWTDAGGGVYSRADGGATAATFIVTTLTDVNGFAVVLAKNTATPTTPAAGEYGQTGGNFYVHLPGDASANSNTIKRPTVSYLFRASGTAKLTIKHCVGRYNNDGGIFENAAAGASLRLENCTGQYSAVGVSGAGGNIVCVNCTMQRCRNDGFNHNLATMTLSDCDGSYNDDEGASPHNGSTLIINGGRYHHNFSGGCTAVNSGTKMYLTNVTVDYNGAKAGGGIESNGINFDTGVSGSITNCTAANNTGSGYYCNSATVTISGLTSGVGQGNTQADVTCA